jgi:50S ribosomal protein uL3
MPVNGILGKKIGMTQVFDEKGEVHPITVLQAGPCVVTQLKTATRDGYDAAQIGLVEFVKASKVTRPQAGHFAKTSVAPVRLQKEVAIEMAKPGAGEEAGTDGVKAGDRVLVDIFSDEKYVDVQGTSKGPRVCGRGAQAQFRRRSEVARAHVSGAGLDWRFVVPVARVSGAENAGTHGRGQGDGAQSADSRNRS